MTQLSTYRQCIGVGMTLVLALCGCRTLREGGSGGDPTPIRRVVCLYSDNPWLNLDKAGDRDPEGLWYYVYLSTGSEPGLRRDGFIEAEMYRIEHHPDGSVTRTLDTSWRSPTSDLPTFGKPGILGQGYALLLGWQRKDTAGHEIELITTFEDTLGRRTRSETKSLRVPKYTR